MEIIPIFLLIPELAKTAAVTTGLGSMGNDGNDRLLCWIHWLPYASTY